MPPGSQLHPRSKDACDPLAQKQLRPHVAALGFCRPVTRFGSRLVSGAHFSGLHVPCQVSKTFLNQWIAPSSGSVELQLPPNA